MVVALAADESGALPLPWLAGPLAQALASQRGHALLVHGSTGVGALPFAITLAHAWLCEAPAQDAARPCGHCGSCRLVRAHLHPDLMVLLPETLRRLHEWPLAEDRAESDDAKRKPSRQIRIDEVRGLIDWSTKTNARGRGKVAVLHPAEALNAQSANALLKTLEEPPPGTRLVLTTADPALLLATVRSRCQWQRLAEPAPDVAAAWLSTQGMSQPAVLLAACSGRPLDALALIRPASAPKPGRPCRRRWPAARPVRWTGGRCRWRWMPCTRSATMRCRVPAAQCRATSCPIVFRRTGDWRRWPCGWTNSTASHGTMIIPGTRACCWRHWSSAELLH